MKTFIFLIFALPSYVFSQESEEVVETPAPFSFIEANRLANEASGRLNKLNGFTNSNSSCGQEKVDLYGNVTMQCEIKESDDSKSPILKLDYEPGKIPSPIRQILPQEFIDDTKNKKVSCLFRFKTLNDNTGAGIKHGDDFGRTLQTEVGVSCTTMDGLTSVYTYSTELFSKGDQNSKALQPNGTTKMNQTFTSENIFSYMQDNIQKGKTSYWRAGVGFINLSQKNKWGIFQSTGQQHFVHNILNQISKGSAFDFQDIEGNKDAWGAFVALSVGLQESRRLSDRCKLSYSAEVGARLSTLSGTSQLTAKAEARLDYKLMGNGSVYLKANAQMIRQNTATVTELSAAAGYKTKKGSYGEVGLIKQIGNYTHVPDFKNIATGKNDLLWYFLIGKRW